MDMQIQFYFINTETGLNHHDSKFCLYSKTRLKLLKLLMNFKIYFEIK